MKITKEAVNWIEGQTKAKHLDPNNQGHRYQVIIEGFWSGNLDLDQASGQLVHIANPTRRTPHPMSQAISMAIMSALAKN